MAQQRKEEERMNNQSGDENIEKKDQMKVEQTQHIQPTLNKSWEGGIIVLTLHSKGIRSPT